MPAYRACQQHSHTQFFTGIPRNTQSNHFYAINYWVCPGYFQNKALWDTHLNALFQFKTALRECCLHFIDGNLQPGSHILLSQCLLILWGRVRSPPQLRKLKSWPGWMSLQAMGSENCNFILKSFSFVPSSDPLYYNAKYLKIIKIFCWTLILKIRYLYNCIYSKTVDRVG